MYVCVCVYIYTYIHIYIICIYTYKHTAPTIALGIAWLTAKFYDYAPDMQGWWQFMNERFEDVNKREDPQTGNVFRMEAPSQEVLYDIVSTVN
jgi:hypothetical protein